VWDIRALQQTFAYVVTRYVTSEAQGQTVHHPLESQQNQCWQKVGEVMTLNPGEDNHLQSQTCLSERRCTSKPKAHGLSCFQAAVLCCEQVKMVFFD